MKDNTQLTTEELLIKKYFGRAFKHRVFQYYSEMTGEKISTHLILKKNEKMEIVIYEDTKYLTLRKGFDKKPEGQIWLSKEEVEQFEKALSRDKKIDEILND